MHVKFTWNIKNERYNEMFYICCLEAGSKAIHITQCTKLIIGNQDNFQKFLTLQTTCELWHC